MEIVDDYKLSVYSMTTISFLHSGYRAIELTPLYIGDTVRIIIDIPSSEKAYHFFVPYTGSVSTRFVDIKDYIQHNHMIYFFDDLCPEKTVLPIKNLYFARYFVFAREVYICAVNRKLENMFKIFKKKIYI